MKKYLFAGLAVTIAAIAVYFYVNKPHRSVSEETALRVSADSLFQAFQANEAEANAKYLNQVIVVSGKVKTVETNTEGKTVIVLDAGDLMFGVNCTLAESTTVAVDQVVSIKGICTGYLADVIINQAIVESQ
jgi:hypothetical protein